MAAASYRAPIPPHPLARSCPVSRRSDGGENSLRATKLFNSTFPAKRWERVWHSGSASSDILLQGSAEPDQGLSYLRYMVTHLNGKKSPVELVLVVLAAGGPLL